jgi:hypothetical protein
MKGGEEHSLSEFDVSQKLPSRLAHNNAEPVAGDEALMVVAPSRPSTIKRSPALLDKTLGGFTQIIPGVGCILIR